MADFQNFTFDIEKYKQDRPKEEPTPQGLASKPEQNKAEPGQVDPMEMLKSDIARYSARYFSPRPKARPDDVSIEGTGPEVLRPQGRKGPEVVRPSAKLSVVEQWEKAMKEAKDLTDFEKEVLQSVTPSLEMREEQGITQSRRSPYIKANDADEPLLEPTPIEESPLQDTGTGLMSRESNVEQDDSTPIVTTEDVVADVLESIEVETPTTEEATTLSMEGIDSETEEDPLESGDDRTRIKAVQKIIGTKADGAWGSNSRAKLKAWQYTNDVPVTGEIDEPTLTKMQSTEGLDPRNITKSDFMQTKTFALLKGVEGFKEKPYLGKISHRFKSGLTVGAGIDFGQHTRKALLDKGLPESLVNKADTAGWVNLNPDTIIDPRTGRPASEGAGTKAQRRARGKELLENKMAQQKRDGTFPEFTYEELAAATPVMYRPYQATARDQYEDVYGEGSWKALSEGPKAVLTTEIYHRGQAYQLPRAMLDAAKDGNARRAAQTIALDSRRNNMLAWLKKVGF